MIYKDKKLDTFDDIFHEALRIAKEESNDCINFQNEYAKFIQESNKKDNLPFDYCFQCTRNNLGYYAGYFDEKEI